MLMNSLDITGIGQDFLGIYLILHGLIHTTLLTYSYDDVRKSNVGWNGNSWLLSRFLERTPVEIIGKGLFIIVLIGFTFSGFAVIGTPVISDYTTILILLSASISTLGYILFIDGFTPTPYEWLLGLSIDIVLIFYVTVFTSAQDIILLLLLLIALIGFVWVFITQIVPQLFPNTSNTT